MRHSIFGFFDQVRHKPTRSISETSLNFEISDVDTPDVILHLHVTKVSNWSLFKFIFSDQTLIILNFIIYQVMKYRKILIQ